MKKITAFVLITMMILGLAACGGESSSSSGAALTEERMKGSESEAPSEALNGDQHQRTEETQAETSGVSSEGNGSDILIAYFTMPEDMETDGVDAIAGSSIVVAEGEVMGNVEYMAAIIQETLGGDLFQIETLQQYPLDHESLVEQAAEEQDADVRPELASHIDNLDQYNTIILGFPNWWGDMPQALYTFLEEYDFTGKTIIPFCPHGGSGFSRTESTIAELAPGAEVSENGLTISRNDVADSAEEVAVWAKSLGL